MSRAVVRKSLLYSVTTDSRTLPQYGSLNSAVTDSSEVTDRSVVSEAEFQGQ